MNSGMVVSFVMPASTATDVASPLRLASRVGIVCEENQRILQARLNALEVAVIMSVRNPSVSRSSESASNRNPSSIAPVRIIPISIGLIFSLESMIPRSAEIGSPLLTTVVASELQPCPCQFLLGYQPR